MWSLEAGFTLLNTLIVFCYTKLTYNFSSAKGQFPTFLVNQKRNDAETHKIFNPPYIMYMYAKSVTVQSNENLVKLE